MAVSRMHSPSQGRRLQVSSSGVPVQRLRIRIFVTRPVGQVLVGQPVGAVGDEKLADVVDPRLFYLGIRRLGIRHARSMAPPQTSKSVSGTDRPESRPSPF